MASGEGEADVMMVAGQPSAPSLASGDDAASGRDPVVDLRVLADALPGLVFITDAAGSNLHVNARFRDFTGRAAEALLGDGWLQSLHPDDRPRAAEVWGAAVSSGEPYDAEYRFRGINGEHRWFLCRGMPVREGGRVARWVGTCFDIDDAKRAEAVTAAAATASEARFRAVFDNNALGMARVAFDGEAFLEVNDALCRITGYARDELVGRSWTSITHPDDIDLEPFRRVAAGEADGYDVEKRYIRKDGRPVWVRLTLSLVRDARGAPDFEICVAEDITARKAAEREQVFRLALTERLRDLDDPHAMMRAATALLGEHLGVAQVGFAEVDDDDAHIVVTHDWTDGRIPSVVGRWRMDAFGPAFVAALKAGETVAIPDVAADPRTAAPEAVGAYAAIRTRAILDRDLIRHGRMLALLFIHHPEPRTWTTDEAALVEEVSERLWAAVERARADRRLRTSEARFRAVQETSTDGFMMFEAVRGDDGAIVDFLCRYANHACGRILGRPREAFIGRGLLETLPGNRDQGLFARYVRLVADGRTWTTEGSYRRDGVDAYVRMVASKAGDGFAVAFADMADRRLAEERLAASEARLRTVLDRMSDGFYAVDADWRLTVFNRAAGEHMGVDPADAVGRTLFEVLGRPDTPADRARLDTTFAAAVGQPIEVESNARPGRFVELRAARLEDAGWALSFTDVTDRRRAAEKLRESESRFRTIADATPQMLWSTRGDGSAEYFNARWYEFTGVAAGTTDGDGWAAMLHPDDRAATRERWRHSLATGEPYETEYRLWHHGGAHRTVLARALPVRDAAGAITRWMGTCTDIEDQVRARAALAASEAQFRLVAEAQPGLLHVTTTDGDNIYVNQGYRDYTGLPAEALLGRGWAAVLHADDLAAAFAGWQAAAAAGTMFTADYRVRRHDGEWRWHSARALPVRDQQGEVLHWIGVAVDIHDRRMAADELERRVAAVVAERQRLWAVSEDLFVTAGFDGYMRECSDSWCRVLGWTVPDLMRRPFAEFIHPDDLPLVADRLDRLRQDGVPVGYENRVRTHDGRWRTIAWRLSLADGGDLLYGVGRDVTVERAQAQELAEAQAQLQQSQKLETIGQLTGGVAHDFNNLLTPIVATLDMLQRKALGGAREQRLVAAAAEAAERARVLVQRLLAFARRQPLQAVPVDTARLVRGMADLVASTTGPHIRLVVDAPDGLPAARADANQVEMAILNLAVNARDAMPKGGTLRMAVARAAVGPGHRSQLAPGNYVHLSVADTGVGMDAETMRRAIEPFFSTKGVGKGTGLGLSMAHGLAAQLGGALTIQSRPGAGTVVELWLPLADALPAGQARGPGPGTAPRCGTALLVDDEELVRASTADMLADLGYAVLEADSAEAALQLIAAGQNIDLLVTDHLMPGLNGSDLAAAARAERPHLPVLLVSGYADDAGVAPDLPRLAKPFRRDELGAVLATIMPTG